MTNNENTPEVKRIETQEKADTAKTIEAIRNIERAQLIERTKRLKEAARQVWIADREGVVNP